MLMNRIGKLLFVFLGICLGGALVFFGINYFFAHDQEGEKEILMQVSEDALPFQEEYVGISFQDLASLELDEEAVDQYLFDHLPECQFPSLQSQQVIVIDEVVKNCRSQEKIGKIPDGLGGACFDWIAYDQAGDHLLAMNDRICHYGIDPQEALQRWVETIFLCKDTSDPAYQIFGTLFKEQNMHSESAIKNAQMGNKPFTLKKVLKSWLLSATIPDVFNLASLYCAEDDLDCKGVYDVGSWADNQGNYFVAGERANLKGKVIYAINDKLYLPWEMKGEFPSWISSSDQKWTSPWLFAGVKNAKIIVKKMKDYVPIGKEFPEYPLESKFTLETCEIDL